MAREIPPEELPRLLGEIEEIRATATARLYSPGPTRLTAPDRLLTIDEASELLGTSRDYLYRHSKEMPFTRRMGRKLLFSSHGIEQHIRQQNGLTAKRQRANLLAS